MSRSAFSLVELAIVLVILGLLTGGILSGQALIRAAELRSVTADGQRFLGAIHSFRDRYFGLPGDFNKATDFWGTDPDGCPTHTNRVAKKETCNGDGKGTVGDGGTSDNERFRFWQHLANAGLIEGSYTGVAGASGGNHHVPGENAPRARISSSFWNQFHVVDQDGTGDQFAGTYRTTISVGGFEKNIFRGEEVWNIDTKLDDGKPGYGIVRERRISDCVASASEYILDSSGGLCRFLIITGY